MDLITHVVFAYILGFGTLNIWSIIGVLIPDIDKVFTYTKGLISGHRSRTAWTELPIASLLIPVALIINKDLALGMVSHYILDYLTGETKPFFPFFKNVVNFNFSLRSKVIIGAIVWLIGVMLFIK